MYNLKIMVMKKLFTMFLIGMIFPMSAQIKGTVTDAGNNPVKCQGGYLLTTRFRADSRYHCQWTGEFEFPAYYSVNKLMKVSYNRYKPITFRALPEQHVTLRMSLPCLMRLAENPTLIGSRKEKLITS